jgi:hypothetical protein
MSLLLKLSGSRRESTVVEQGEFDPETQLWSTVRDAGSFEDALKVLASGGTSNSGTTAAETKRYKDKDIQVADSDGDDTLA